MFWVCDTYTRRYKLQVLYYMNFCFFTVINEMSVLICMTVTFLFLKWMISSRSLNWRLQVELLACMWDM